MKFSPIGLNSENIVTWIFLRVGRKKVGETNGKVSVGRKSIYLLVALPSGVSITAHLFSPLLPFFSPPFEWWTKVSFLFYLRGFFFYFGSWIVIETQFWRTNRESFVGWPSKKRAKNASLKRRLFSCIKHICILKGFCSNIFFLRLRILIKAEGRKWSLLAVVNQSGEA